MNPLVTSTENPKLSCSSVKHIVIQEASNRADLNEGSNSSLSIFRHSTTQHCENCKKQCCTAR